MRICVYGAASPTIDKEYIDLVEKMGQEMANRGHSLVFGGGNGLMGAAARGAENTPIKHLDKLNIVERFTILTIYSLKLYK